MGLGVAFVSCVSPGFTPLRSGFGKGTGHRHILICVKVCQLLTVGRWFPLGTPSFHRLDMTLAVAEALSP